MNAEKRLKAYKDSKRILPDENKLKETVIKSIDVFCTAEQEKLLTCREFLWVQLRLIRKRWWLLQLSLLVMLWAVLPSLPGGLPRQRVFGAVTCLFVILIIPELWKSQTYRSMEIEAASYYSLRRVYAARMLLFGVVDIVLVTLFCGLATITMKVLFSQLLAQFLFPMAVTACICFGILSSKYPIGETTAVMLCSAWSAVWLTVILNEKIYAAITFPLWLVFLGTAVLFLAFAVRRTLRRCNHYWEVGLNGIEIG